jgi:hypothetical protein
MRVQQVMCVKKSLCPRIKKSPGHLFKYLTPFRWRNEVFSRFSPSWIRLGIYLGSHGRTVGRGKIGTETKSPFWCYRDQHQPDDPDQKLSLQGKKIFYVPKFRFRFRQNTTSYFSIKMDRWFSTKTCITYIMYSCVTGRN